MDDIKIGDYVIADKIEDSIYETNKYLTKGQRYKVLGLDGMLTIELDNGKRDSLFSWRFIKCPSVIKFDNKLKDILK